MTGGCRSTRGDRRLPAECGIVTRDADESSQARGVVVLSLAMSADDSLPEDIATLKAMLVAERAARLAAEAKARSAEAEAHARALQIEKLKFAIAKLRHQRFGQSAERGALIEQLELQLADLEENAAEAEAAAEMRRRRRASMPFRCAALNGRSRRAVRCRSTFRASGSSTGVRRSDSTSVRIDRVSMATAGVGIGPSRRTSRPIAVKPATSAVSIRPGKPCVVADDHPVPVLAIPENKAGRPAAQGQP